MEAEQMGWQGGSTGRCLRATKERDSAYWKQHHTASWAHLVLWQRYRFFTRKT